MTATDPDPGKPRLLVVDDEADMLDFLERVLRRRFAVTRVSSADDALRELSAASYDVLLTDQKMPRVSGLELIDRVGRTQPRLVKVLLSGFTELDDIRRAVEAGGIHNYILKPVDSQKLMTGIDEAYRVRDGLSTLRPPVE